MHRVTRQPIEVRRADLSIAREPGAIVALLIGQDE
jgi:hypothetical protein